jgi:cytidylate kinase
MIVAIDGTVASGKSTAARSLAERLGFLYINTGLMYRGVAAHARVNGIPTFDRERISTCVRGLRIDLKNMNDTQHVFVNGVDLTREATAPDIGPDVSNVADNDIVREVLVNEQRRLGLESGNAVLEGRDIGSVVFPDADIKFFVTADTHERARRRLADDREKNPDITIEEVEQLLIQRDRRDCERPVGALKHLDDAIDIDTTHTTPGEVVELMLKHIREKNEQA